MTDSVHAIDAAAIGEPGCAAYTFLQRAYRPFSRGPFALFSEARGGKAGAGDALAGSPAQDFLTGKGGFLQIFTHGLTGLRLRENALHLDPVLPPQLADGGVWLSGLRWRGRTYDIHIGRTTTTVRLRSGAPFTLETPTGPVRLTGTATLRTRRPDLAPTTDLARCRPATATSSEPGLYPEAAVDGSPATTWSPSAERASLTVDLGRGAQVGSVEPTWTEQPASYTVEVSADGQGWHAPDGTAVRFVRVTVRGPAALAELDVRR